jgi:hypothetical protein
MADRIEKELSRSEFADYLATMAAAQLRACNQSSKRGEKKQRSRKTKDNIQKFEAKFK